MEKLLVKDIHDSQFEAWEGARTKRPEDDDEDENDDDDQEDRRDDADEVDATVEDIAASHSKTNACT